MKYSELRSLIREEIHLILEETNLVSDFNNSIGPKLEKLLPHVLIKSNGVMASTHKGKTEPAIRIDSKLKPTALWLETKTYSDEFHAIIKTIVNNKENNLPGYGQKILQVIIDTIEEQQKQHENIKYIIDIDHDVSGGFWTHVVKKHPNINWRYVG